MEIELTTKDFENNYLSDLKNPFIKDKIKSIPIDIEEQLFDDHVSCVARVRFVNGNTSAVHTIQKLEFIDLVKELDQFIKSINS